MDNDAVDATPSNVPAKEPVMREALVKSIKLPEATYKDADILTSSKLAEFTYNIWSMHINMEDSN
jgi:hypothetical protein